MQRARFLLLFLAAPAIAACGSSGTIVGAPDASSDAATLDAGPIEAGADAPSTTVDAGADASALSQGVCTPSGWCWTAPLPEGNQLQGVWASSDHDAWAAGEMGVAVHWDGASWSQVTTGTTQALAGVWGSGPADVWAVGAGGTVLRWDGAAWKASNAGTSQDLAHVWGSGAGDVWAVGAAGTTLHWTGSAWTAMPSGTTADLGFVWGLDASHVFATAPGHCVASADAGDECATYADGALLRWNGDSWAPMTLPALPGGAWLGDVNTAWASGPDDVWVGLRGGNIGRWNGTAWQVTTVDVHGMAPFERIWGTGPNDVWAVQNGGWSWHWDGSGWTNPNLTGTDEGNPDCMMSDAWSGAGTGAWLVNTCGGVYEWSGSAWSSVPAASLPSDSFDGELAVSWIGLWGSGPSDVWAVGTDATTTGFFGHWDGARWTYSQPAVANMFPPSSTTSSALWGTASNDVWAAGAGGIAHFDGSAWSASWTFAGEPAGPALDAIWGSGPNDVWAAGENCCGSEASAVLHWDGSAWSTALDPALAAIRADADIRSIWGSAADDVWMVGYLDVLHFDGKAWTNFANGTDLPMTATANAVWGSSATDVWFGYSTTFLHWDGAHFTSVPGPTSGGLGGVTAITGTGPNDVYAVGSLLDSAVPSGRLTGGAVHWDGHAWSAAALPTTNLLATAWTSSAGDVFLAGSGTTILRHE